MNRNIFLPVIAASLMFVSASSHAGPMGNPGGVGDAGILTEMDLNGDGKVTKAEFDAFQSGQFAALDENHDGVLEGDELQGRNRNSATAHLDRRFNAADANHDGGLDRTEAGAMPMLSIYFDEVDANKDGKVTRQEYFDAMPLLHRAKQGRSDSL